MKVILVGKGLLRPRGGAEWASHKWVEYLNKRVDCTIVTNQNHARNDKQGLIDDFAPLGYFKGVKNLSRKLAQVSKEVSPDLIHIHSYTGNVVIPPKDIPTVITLHDEPGVTLNDWISSPYACMFNRFMSQLEHFFRQWMSSANPWFHALSSSVYQHLLKLGVNPTKVAVIPNGFQSAKPTFQLQPKHELTRKLGLPDNSHMIITIGNLSFRKAAHKILFAAYFTKQERDDIQYLVVGSKNSPMERAYVSSLIRWQRKNGIDNFHLLGYVDQKLLDNLLHHSSAYLSPSLSEACNLGLMEAAVFGLPIIASDVGAAKDLFDCEAKIIARDAKPREISDAVLSTLENGRKKYQSIPQNSWDEVANRMVKWYTQILNQ